MQQAHEIANEVFNKRNGARNHAHFVGQVFIRDKIAELFEPLDVLQAGTAECCEEQS